MTWDIPDAAYPRNHVALIAAYDSDTLDADVAASAIACHEFGTGKGGWVTVSDITRDDPATLPQLVYGTSVQAVAPPHNFAVWTLT